MQNGIKTFRCKRLQQQNFLYRADKFSAIANYFNSPDGIPNNFRYCVFMCVLQRILHRRTLKHALKL